MGPASNIRQLKITRKLYSERSSKRINGLSEKKMCIYLSFSTPVSISLPLFLTLSPHFSISLPLFLTLSPHFSTWHLHLSQFFNFFIALNLSLSISQSFSPSLFLNPSLNTERAQRMVVALQLSISLSISLQISLSLTLSSFLNYQLWDSQRSAIPTNFNCNR